MSIFHVFNMHDTVVREETILRENMCPHLIPEEKQGEKRPRRIKAMARFVAAGRVGVGRMCFHACNINNTGVREETTLKD